MSYGRAASTGTQVSLGWEKAYYSLFATESSFTIKLRGGYLEVSLHSGVITLVPSAPSMLWCRADPVSAPVLSWAMHGPYWAMIKSVVWNNHEGNLWNPEKEKHFIQLVWWKSSIGGIVLRKPTNETQNFHREGKQDSNYSLSSPLGNQREYSVFIIFFPQVFSYIEDKCLCGKRNYITDRYLFICREMALFSRK